MNSNDLSFFSAVATSGGIGRAALALNTVQSNVTQRIQALETQLGVKLFDRSKTGVTLTLVGRQLAPYAIRVAALLNEAKLVVKDSSDAGEIRIGCLETTAAIRLPAIVKGFVATHPKIDLHIETGPTQDLIERLLARQLDGAFVSGPVRHADLVATPMIQEELVLVAPAQVETRKHLLRLLAGSTTVKALVFRNGCSYRQRTAEVLAHIGCHAVRWMEMGTLDGIVGCVASGVGVALLPRAVVATAARTYDISLHAVGAKDARAETVFATRRDAFVPRAFHDFIATAMTTLSEEANPLSRRRKAKA